MERTWVSVLLVAEIAGGATLVSSVSTLNTGATPPPFELALGSGATKSWFVSSLTIGSNKTYATGNLRPVAGAETRVKEILVLRSKVTSSLTVTLQGSSIPTLTWKSVELSVRDGTAVLALLNLTSPSPSASLALSPLQSVSLDLRTLLVEGASLPDSSTLRWTVRIS